MHVAGSRGYVRHGPRAVATLANPKSHTKASLPSTKMLGGLMSLRTKRNTGCGPIYTTRPE